MILTSFLLFDNRIRTSLKSKKFSPLEDGWISRTAIISSVKPVFRMMGIARHGDLDSRLSTAYIPLHLIIIFVKKKMAIFALLFLQLPFDIIYISYRETAPTLCGRTNSSPSMIV
jgi:hypothetical protein